MLGPVSAGYPGKYVWFGFAACVVGLYGAAIVHLLRQPNAVRNPQRGIRKDEHIRHVSLGQLFGLGVICALLIGAALWSVYLHWPE